MGNSEIIKNTKRTELPVLFYYKESNHGPIRHQHNLRTPTLRKGSKELYSALWSTGVIASLQSKL